MTPKDTVACVRPGEITRFATLEPNGHTVARQGSLYPETLGITEPGVYRISVERIGDLGADDHDDRRILKAAGPEAAEAEVVDEEWLAAAGPNPGLAWLRIAVARRHHTVQTARSLVLPDDSGALRCIACLQVVPLDRVSRVGTTTIIDRHGEVGEMHSYRANVGPIVTGYEWLCCGQDPNA